ncbi:hypothetical protein [Polymorphobacter sp.]|uniref:hypothetical protein n=1 Tax=Polymorphobacter sp. TaxID=1909290 RepID=UPI003F6E5B95
MILMVALAALAPLQAETGPMAAAARVIPAGTPVMLQVDVPLSSKTARRGDRFPLTSLSDIVVDGQVVVPRGAHGEGQVVHSAGTGFGGRPGELLLAARHLMVGGVPLKLLGFRIGKAGANNTAEALVATNVVPLAGLLVTGSSALVSAGQIGTAKTAEAFVIPETRPDSPTDVVHNEEHDQ